MSFFSEEIPEGETAQSLADGYLAQSLPDPFNRAVSHIAARACTRTNQTFTVPARDLNSVAIITAVNMREFGPARVEYSVETTLADDTNIPKTISPISTSSGAAISWALAAVARRRARACPRRRPGAPRFDRYQFNRYGVSGGARRPILFYEEYSRP